MRKVVEITWEDAAYDSTTRVAGDLPHTVMCKTVGYLLHKDKHAVMIAGEVSPQDNTIRHTVVIPMSIVRKYAIVGYGDN